MFVFILLVPAFIQFFDDKDPNGGNQEFSGIGKTHMNGLVRPIKWRLSSENIGRAHGVYLCMRCCWKRRYKAWTVLFLFHHSLTSEKIWVSLLNSFCSISNLTRSLLKLMKPKKQIHPRLLLNLASVLLFPVTRCVYKYWRVSLVCEE